MQLRAKFSKFDQDNSGCLSASEVAAAFENLESILLAHGKDSVPFTSFPDSVQEELVMVALYEK